GIGVAWRERSLSPIAATDRRPLTRTGRDDMDFLWLILIGLGAGWLASRFLQGGNFGGAGDVLLGVGGALIGGVLFRQLSLPTGGGLIGTLIVAAIGAVFLLFLVRVLKRA